MQNLSKILLLFFLLQGANCAAQTNTKIDSLKAIIKNAVIDSVKLNNLIKLKGLLTSQDDIIRCLNEEILLAGKNKNIKTLAGAIAEKGWYTYTSGDLENAEALLVQSIVICQKNNLLETEGSCYTTLMMIYWWKGETEKGISFFEKAESIFEKLEKPALLSNLYLNISEMYKNLERYDKAVAFAQKSLDYAIISKDSSKIISSTLFLGDAYRADNKPALAKKNLQNALQMAIRQKDEVEEADARYFFCNLFYASKDYTSAIRYGNEALNIFIRLGMKPRANSAMNLLAEVYFVNKEINKCEELTIKMQQYQQAENNMDNRYYFARLANIALTRMDTETWRLFSDKADSLENLYTGSAVKNAVLELETKYQTVKNEKQIITLKNERQNQYIIIYGLVSGLIAFSVIGFLVYRNLAIRKKSDEQKLQQLQQEKKLIATNSILQAQEAERSRMAKDLHDGLGGMLSGIKLNLSSMKGNVIIQEKDALLFSKSIEQLDNAIAEMRRIAHNMMPEALLKFGLGEAINDFCDGINQSGEVNIRFTQLGMKEPLPQPTEVILYRIIQELCNNALKHAAAKNIFVQLNKHEKGITLTVEDDGNGFDSKVLDKIKGAGLQNVQSRIDYLKGVYTIESELKKGTSVYVEVPL